MNVRLRSYQIEALDAEAAHRAEHPDETRLAIVLPTGTGKTIVLAERARRFLDAGFNRVLILVHTDELAQQAEAKVRLVVGERWKVGVVKAERDETDADIIIGSVQTLANPARRARISDVGLVIVDECHHAVSVSYQAIMRHFGCMEGNNPCSLHTGWISADDQWLECTPGCLGNLPHKQKIPALGFTATLERGDGQGLGEIWQDVAYSRDVSWAVRKGYLVQPVGYRLELSGHPDAITDAALDDFLTDQLAPEKIVEKWVEIAKDRPTVAFMPLVRSAKLLRDKFLDQGIEAEVIHGDMDPRIRRRSLLDYEEGRIQVLVNAMVLTEGWDSPRTSCVIVGRPTKSRALFTQMAGRGLRPVPGMPVEEQDCILISVADATTDLCSIADLSDRTGLDRAAEGALTVMEDAWDIGQALDEQEKAKFWQGHVSAEQFDPLVRRSSKVWRTTTHGTPFLPISKDREYVFVVGTSVFVREVIELAHIPEGNRTIARRLHKDLPDLELALSIAEDEATDRGGDLGRLLADRNRPWRNLRPSEEMLTYAKSLGLEKDVDRIMAARAGGKAGKVSDLVSKVIATRALEPMVKRIKEATA